MKKNGFTFLELMIAVVIGAFVTVTAVAAMRGIVAGKQMHQHLTELGDEMRYAGCLVRQDLNNLCRSNNFRNVKFDLSYLDGDNGRSVQSLTFYTVSRKKARPLQPEGDVYEIQYFVKGDVDAEQFVLMRRCCPVAPGIAVADDVRRSGILAPIAENIAGMKVRCYNGTEWVDEWGQENGQYPQLVEVALLAGGDSKKALQRSLLIHLPQAKARSEQADADSKEEGGTQGRPDAESDTHGRSPDVINKEGVRP